MSSPPYSDATAKRVLAEIDENETIAFLRDLVRFPSVNPPGDVRDAIAFCSQKLEKEGFSCRTVAIDEIMPSLIAEFGPADGPTLCFNAHLDVVPTGERSPGRTTHSPPIWWTAGSTDVAPATTRRASPRKSWPRLRWPVRGCRSRAG